MRQTIHLIIFIAIAALLMVGCTGGSGTKHVPQASDTLYTEKAAMDVYAKEPERALSIIDSALIVGNVTKDRADLLRATVYSRAYEATRQDTAIVIGERLLNGKTAQDDVTFRQSVLEVLVYSARQLEDYELQLSYSTKLADAYRQQGDKVEALRTEAEIGAVLVRLGKTDEGLAKLDSVINRLTPVRKFNELDASIIAMKRKIGVIWDYPQIETTAQCIINRLDDFEQHPADFHDGSEREPADENRSGYIAFYRSQAWSYLAAAYAHLSEKRKASEYVALFEKSDLGQTLAGRKMIAPTLCLLGEYDKMETIYKELEAVSMERGDTLTIDYAQLLLDRAKAAEAQGRMKESTTLWQKHAKVLQKSEERLLQSKANLYAARYHAQEQQREIERKDAEAKHNALFAWFVAVIALLLACFAVYYYLRHREESRKNRILARQITEAMDYKDKYLESEKLRVKNLLPQQSSQILLLKACLAKPFSSTSARPSSRNSCSSTRRSTARLPSTDSTYRRNASVPPSLRAATTPPLPTSSTSAAWSMPSPCCATSPLCPLHMWLRPADSPMPTISVASSRPVLVSRRPIIVLVTRKSV